MNLLGVISLTSECFVHIVFPRGRDFQKVNMLAVISLTSATQLFIFRVCFCLCVCTCSRECHQSSYVYLFIFPIKPKCNMYTVLSTGIVTIKNMKG